MMVTDLLGRAAGVLVAPFSGALSFLRQARMFHPVGVVYRAEVFPVAGEPAAQRLGGPALLRFSGAWWKHREWPDVLGLAIRLRASAAPDPTAAPGDQDLLFATVSRPWTTPFAPLATKVHDYLANVYNGVSPFEVNGLGRRYLRAVAVDPPEDTAGESRAEKLEKAVAAGNVKLRIESSPSPDGAWTALAEVRLIEDITDEVDQGVLHFSPFRDGRGVEPRGFVHGLRRAVYAASQTLRPAHEAR